MRVVALPTLFHAAVVRHIRLVALAAGAGLLSGCLSLAPPDERPAAPIPAVFPDPSGNTSEAQVPAWQGYFVDVHLQALIRQALANNRDLRAAVARVEQARAGYGIRSADQWPTVGAGAAYARFRAPGGFLTPAPVIGQVYEVQFAETQWEIDFWGRVRNMKESALQRYLASEAARQAVTLSVITGVADTYLTLCEIDERIALTRATIDTRRESLRIFRLRHAAGAISRLDLTQSEILLQQAESLDTQLQQARASAADALALLVGATPDLADTPLTLDDGAVMPSLAPGLPASLLARRPDVMAAEHELQATRANIGAARAAFFPRIALTSAIGSGSSALHDLLSSGAGVWSVIPNVTLPLIDGGRNRSNLALARAQRDEALARYEKTVQRAFRDVSDALAARYWLAGQVAIERATLASQAERARLAKLRYDSGATRFLEVLDAQRDLMNAEQQWVMARRALLSSRVALYGALGGGTTDAGQTAAARDHLSTDSGSRQ